MSTNITNMFSFFNRYPRKSRIENYSLPDTTPSGAIANGVIQKLEASTSLVLERYKENNSIPPGSQLDVRTIRGNLCNITNFFMHNDRSYISSFQKETQFLNNYSGSQKSALQSFGSRTFGLLFKEVMQNNNYLTDKKILEQWISTLAKDSNYLEKEVVVQNLNHFNKLVKTALGIN